MKHTHCVLLLRVLTHMLCQDWASREHMRLVAMWEFETRHHALYLCYIYEICSNTFSSTFNNLTGELQVRWKSNIWCRKSPSCVLNIQVSQTVCFSYKFDRLYAWNWQVVFPRLPLLFLNVCFGWRMCHGTCAWVSYISYMCAREHSCCSCLECQSSFTGCSVHTYSIASKCWCNLTWA